MLAEHALLMISFVTALTFSRKASLSKAFFSHRSGRSNSASAFARRSFTDFCGSFSLRPFHCDPALGLERQILPLTRKESLSARR